MFNKFGEYDKEDEEKRLAELVVCLNATEDEDDAEEENSVGETND